MVAAPAARAAAESGDVMPPMEVVMSMTDMRTLDEQNVSGHQEVFVELAYTMSVSALLNRDSVYILREYQKQSANVL